MGDIVTHVPDAPEKITQDTGDTLVSPVLQHTERLTNLERDLPQAEERLNKKLLETEAQLREAIQANAAQKTIEELTQRVLSLESKLEATATQTARATEAAPSGAVDFVAPEVEESPTPPEKERRSIRHRRKARRTKK